MKREVAIVGALAALAFAVRLALVPSTDGIDWDGPGYMLEAERLSDLLAGRLPSVHGERAPFLYPIGLPLLLALLSPLAGSTRDAGVVLSLLAGTALVPLAFLLARKLSGETAGLLAASFVALDPELVNRAHTLNSESVFAALAAAGLVLLPDEAPLENKDEGTGRRRLALASALLVLAALVRSIGVVTGALASASLYRRGERRAAAIVLASLALVAVFQKGIEARNAAPSYAATLAALSFWEESEGPGFWDVDDAGTTIRHATDDRGALALASEKPAVAARIVRDSALATLRALLPLALAVPFGVSRRSLLLLLWIAAAALVPLALLQHSEYMPRMLLPFRPELVVLSAAGLVRAGARVKVSSGAATALALLVGAGGALALLCASAEPSFAPSTERPSRRALATAAAARISALVPPSERVLRGAGGERTLIALAGRADVFLPSTTPGKLRAFCSANGLRFVVHDGSVPLGPLFAPARVTTVDLGYAARGSGSLHPQLLSRLGD